jgi:hypothetical protein
VPQYFEFAPGTTVETEERAVGVVLGRSPGVHHFRLVVVDDEGNRSEPAEIMVVMGNEDGSYDA